MNYPHIDIAVAWGLAPPPLPEIEDCEDLLAEPDDTPPELVAGMLHRGSKLVLGGTSKSNKSWCLIDMAVSVASGSTWWGRPCTKARTLYLNFELPRWAVRRRIRSILQARPDTPNPGKWLKVWNLRGRAADISTLKPILQRQLVRYDFGLIILDPAYKLLGDRDENANGDITSLMNEFEGLCSSTGAALVIAHHFAKGDPSVKDPIDRISGAGAWARDPDSILILTPHEEENCFTVTSILRNFPAVPEFVLEWDHPVMRMASDLSPAAIRTRQSARKVCTDREFIDLFLSTAPKARHLIVDSAAEYGVASRTVDRYLSRLCAGGQIKFGNGLYWVESR